MSGKQNCHDLIFYHLKEQIVAATYQHFFDKYPFVIFLLTLLLLLLLPLPLLFAAVGTGVVVAVVTVVAAAAVENPICE